MDIEKKVTEIIIDTLGVDAGEVTPSATFTEDLGADSLEIVNLIMALEDAFGIVIPDDDVADKIKSVRDAVEYLRGRAAE